LKMSTEQKCRLLFHSAYDTNFDELHQFMGDIILKEGSYKVIGICMQVHTNFGLGFKEAVYKDA